MIGQIFKKTLLILIGIILAFSLAEIIARVILPKDQQKPRDVAYRFPCYEKGTYYWFRLKANQKCILHSNALAFDDLIIKTNSLHLRNPEVPQKATDSARILFIGDSFTFGMGVEEDQAFPRLVGRYINQPLTDKKVESINAGLSGTGIGYYYLYYKNDGYKLKPDVVVIGFHPFNDIHDNEFKPVWDMDNEGLPLKITSNLAKVDKSGFLVATNMPLKYKNSFIASSKILSLLTDKSFVHSQKRPAQSLLEAACLFKSSCHNLDQQKLRSQLLFKRLQSLTRQNNQQLLVVMIPAIFQVYDEYRSRYSILVPLSPKERAYPHNEFADFFQKEGIDYIDMLPILTSSPERSYFLADGHWNETGHKLAALEITKKIVEYLNK